MGTPKAMLTLEGRTFVKRVVHALGEGGCATVHVVVAKGDDVTAAEAERSGARVLRNPSPGEGPITSLRMVLQALEPDVDGVAWLPLDHPLVTPDVVRTILEAAADGCVPLTIPVHGRKRGHPAVFARTLFAELLDPGLEGGARTVVHRHLHEARLVGIDDPGVIEDIDTPEAYRRIRSSLAPGGAG
jgi:molybdenum cofactor cytidylyltransferase